ncbi:hypothetical protein [Methanosarcina barkeri]|jgi:hypothetical protein|uniref:Uncharacterized protein n=1 Tax=Methanosarcina barkeri 227 TaxID=1434106 RepID=A0A0E3LPU8_METBA|nr:hypothetical protein [Methanosarcina barkeri]AKB57146.1 hypothetical protein MSBR2_0630 [Methanosarcina barkeri 227]
MPEENGSKNIGDKGYGINAGGDVHIGDISGQFAIGTNISQVQSPSPTDIENLKKSLLDLQKELSNLDLSSEDQDIIKGDMSAAIKEAGKEEPKLQNIKSRVENIIETLKDAGKTVKNISEICGSIKIAATLLGITL